MYLAFSNAKNSNSIHEVNLNLSFYLYGFNDVVSSGRLCLIFIFTSKSAMRARCFRKRNCAGSLITITITVFRDARKGKCPTVQLRVQLLDE